MSGRSSRQRERGTPERMSRTETWIVSAAFAAFAISWFLPVMHAGQLLGEIARGWKAFLLALSYAIKPDRLGWFWALCIAGVLGNVAVLLTPWMLRKPMVPIWYLLLLMVSLSNLAWLYAAEMDLEIGYWLWFGSMLTLGLIVLRRHRAARLALAGAAASRSVGTDGSRA